MLYMRQILKDLMEKNGHTGHSLYELSGVPSATTYRFLTGSHGEPRSTTVRRWARVYNITERQLRGDEPIEGLTVENPGQQPMTLESVLTNDELAAIEGMRQLDKETRRSWLRLTKLLCKNTYPGDQRITPDRRSGGMRSLSAGSKGKKYRKGGGTEAESKKA